MYSGKHGIMRLGNAIAAAVIALLCAGAALGKEGTPPAAATAAPQADKQYVRHIIIHGNQRIEESTILTYLNMTEGAEFNQYDIDTALKNLYATGFFADAKITPGASDGNKVDLTVEVLENPIIDKVQFEGNHAVDDKDLTAELELKQARCLHSHQAAKRCKAYPRYLSPRRALFGAGRAQSHRA